MEVWPVASVRRRIGQQVLQRADPLTSRGTKRAGGIGVGAS